MTLFKPKPLPDESLYSYLFRYAKGNYVDSISILTGYQIANNLNYSEDKVLFKCIKKIVGDQNIFDKLVLNKYDYPFLGIGLDGDFFSKISTANYYLKNRTKCCPLCLNEKNYHRIVWDIRIITTCLKHKVYLLDKCPKCLEKIEIKNILNEECKCGIKHANMTVEKIVDNEVMRSQSDIYQALIFNKDFIDTKKRRLSTDVYFKLFHSICKILHGVSTNDIIFKNHFCPTEKVISFRYEQNTDDNIYSLTAMSNLVHSMIIDLKKEDYNYFFLIFDQNRNNRRLSKALKNVVTMNADIHEFYLEYVYKSSNQLYTKQSFLALTDSELNNYKKRYMTLNEAAKFLGISYQYLKKLAEQRKIPSEVRIYKNNKTQVFIQEKLIEWKKYYDELLTRDDIQKKLEIGRGFFDNLISYQRLTPYFTLNDNRTNKYLFEYKEYSALIDAIKINVSSLKKIDRDLISIFDFCVKFKLNLSFVIQIIQSNKIETFILFDYQTSLKQIFLNKEDSGFIKSTLLARKFIHTKERSVDLEKNYD